MNKTYMNINIAVCTSNFTINYLSSIQIKEH